MMEQLNRKKLLPVTVSLPELKNQKQKKQLPNRKKMLLKIRARKRKKMLLPVTVILKQNRQKKQLKKAVEAEVSTLENYIKQMLGDASEGSDDSYKVTWKNRTSTRFDSKRFKVEHAKLYKRYTNETTSRTFLLAPIKKAKEAIK